MTTNNCPKCFATITPEDAFCSYCGLQLKKFASGKRSTAYLKAMAIINILFMILMFGAFVWVIATEQTLDVAGVLILVWFGGILLLSFVTLILEIIFRAGSIAAKVVVIFKFIIDIVMLLGVIFTVVSNMEDIVIGSVAMLWALISFILSICLLFLSRSRT